MASDEDIDGDCQSLKWQTYGLMSKQFKRIDRQKRIISLNESKGYPKHSPMAKMLNDFKVYLANERHNEIKEARRRRIQALIAAKEAQKPENKLMDAFDIPIEESIMDDIHLEPIKCDPSEA